MARCTKEQAQATRDHLLDAAEREFAQRGVSRTALMDIAQAAGVSRGAIYWHFKNKADLFNAMMERITLPMEQALQHIALDAQSDPLDDLTAAMLNALQSIETDERTRRVFEVATLKVEYVDELLAVKTRQVQTQVEVVRQIQRSLQEAARRREWSLPVPAVLASRGLHSLVVGLIHSWLLDPKAFKLVAVAQVSIHTYLAGLGLRR